MGDTPICIIDATGIHKPAFTDCLDYFQSNMRGIYGSDLYLGNDSQDGQWVGLLATALDDVNAMCVQDYQSYRVAQSQGVGLSSVVKTNGIERLIPSYSTADIVVTGQVGIDINDGIVSDGVNEWNLPSLVTIPISGQITVTATAAALGAITVAANTINQISTPTKGWQAATNPNPSSPGDPVETDPQLKARQELSTSIPSQSLLDGTIGAILELPGINRIRGYDNDTNVPDANGQPGHTIAIVVDGGDAQSIADLIRLKKGGGTGTYGDTVQTSFDTKGLPHIIRFFRPTEPPITYSITMRVFDGFTTDIQAEIQQSVSDWTNALGIGKSVLLNRANVPAQLYGAADSLTYEITQIQAARDGVPVSSSDIVIAFNEAATCDSSFVSIFFVS